MHVEEGGGLFQVQRVHWGVESRANGLSFAEPHAIAPAQGRSAGCARGGAEASVEEGSVLAHIHARNVESTAIAVAQVLGGRRPRLAFAIALSAIGFHSLLCKGITGCMTLQVRPMAQIAIHAEGFLEIGCRAVGTRDEITLLCCP